MKRAFPSSKKTAFVLPVSDSNLNFPFKNSHTTFTTRPNESTVATEASLILQTSESNLPLESENATVVVESIHQANPPATNTTLAMTASKSADPVESESTALVAEFQEQNILHSKETSFTLPTSEAYFPPAQEASFAESDSKLQTIFFDVNSSDLTKKAKDVLRENIQWLKENPYITEVILEGHCDPLGSEDYNIELGWKRVNSVKEYLTLHGIPEEKLKTESFGEARPLSIEEDEQEINRRVEFVLIY